jgi:tRNA(His) 5'-end guanylyltransferase
MTKSKYDSDEFGSRMKAYEKIPNIQLTPRCPVIIRLDGNRFSRLTKRLPKPSYDFLELMAQAMRDTAQAIDGCVFGYTQSDEVTLVLRNDQSYTSTPWFDNRVQKMTSLSASIMTENFCNRFHDLELDNDMRKLIAPRFRFDSRVYVVPNEVEMVNALYWRQLDCMKNAISMIAEYRLREKLGKKTALKLLHGKGKTERLQLLKDECGINFFTRYPLSFQRGTIAYKTTYEKDGAVRTKMTLDYKPPNFHKEQDLILNAYACTAREEVKKSKEKRNG